MGGLSICYTILKESLAFNFFLILLYKNALFCMFSVILRGSYDGLVKGNSSEAENKALGLGIRRRETLLLLFSLLLDE